MHGNWRTKVLVSYTLNPTRNLCDLSVGYYIVLHQQMSSCSWVNWWLHLHPTLIALKLELNYLLTQYWFTIIIMRLELGLKCGLEFRTSGMLHRGVSLSGPITGYREANENSIKRTTSTPAAADPAGCADYLSLAWHVSLRFSSAPLDGKIGRWAWGSHQHWNAKRKNASNCSKEWAALRFVTHLT